MKWIHKASMRTPNPQICEIIEETDDEYIVKWETGNTQDYPKDMFKNLFCSFERGMLDYQREINNKLGELYALYEPKEKTDETQTSD